MQTPVGDILARGSTRRRQRRLTGLGVTAMVVVAGMAVGVPAFTGSAPPAPPAASTGAAGSLQLAAFSVVRNPNGTATLTLPKSRILDPEAVRRALADAGVPAIIKIGSFCHAEGKSARHDGVVSSQKGPDGAVIIVIDPSAMPPGTQLSFGYRPQAATGSKDRVRFTLVPVGASLTCDDYS
jgi:hypothetical protein